MATPGYCKKIGSDGQKEIVALELKMFNGYLEVGDLVSRPMGSPGEDIMMSPKAMKCLPLAQEVKYGKTYKQIYGLYEQAVAHAETLLQTTNKVATPVTHVRLRVDTRKEPRKDFLSIIKTEDLIGLYKELFDAKNKTTN